VTRALVGLASAAAVAITAVALPSNSVGTRQLRSRSVTPAKLAPVPAARLQTSTITVPSNAITTVRFDATAFQTASMATAGRDGLRAPRGGIYAVDSGFRFPANRAGARAIFITVAGTDGFAANEEDGATEDPARSRIMAASTLVQLRRGQVVQLQVFQESGAPMAIPSDARSFLAMHFVSPAPRRR
jgi:hypothetical protein